MERCKEIILLLCLIVFTVLIRIPALPQPLGPDQGIMSAIGQGMLRGEIPYKDNWEMASPAIFVTYALIFKIFGNGMIAVPAVDTIVASVNMILIFLLGRKLYGSRYGLFGAFLYALFSNGVSIGMNSAGELTAGTYWYTAQRESFVSPLSVLGTIIVLKGREDGKTIWFGCVGLLGGIIFLFKFPFLLIFLLQLVFLNDQKNLRAQVFRREFFIRNGSAALGFIAALIPVLWFFWSKGAFHEMIDATFTYVYSIYGEMQVSYTGTIKAGLIKTITVAREGFLLWIFATVSSVFIIFNERNRKNMLVVCWAATSFLIVVAHREFFGYHYLVMFPPLSILATYGVKKIFEQNPMPKFSMVKDIRLMIIVLAILANMVIYVSLNYKHYTRFLRYATGQKSIQWYYGHFTAYPTHEYSFAADYLVSEFLKEKAHPTDLLFVLGGIESVIYVLTDLKSPSRFIYTWFLFSTERSHTAIAERYRKELLYDLETKSPKYIVSIGPLDNYSRFIEFHEYVKSKYQLIKSFPDDRYLYLLKT